MYGYLQKDPAKARYSLGLRLHSLGSAAVRHQQLRWQSLPPLQQLAQQTGETVHVGVLFEGSVICVQAVDGTHMVRTESLLGKHSPIHASAMGKILLAYLPEHELDALLAGRKFARFTPKTITDPAALRRALHRVRVQEWVLDDEEMETGLRCIAAPILDRYRPSLCFGRRFRAGHTAGAGVHSTTPTAAAERNAAYHADARRSDDPQSRGQRGLNKKIREVAMSAKHSSR